MEQGLAWPLPIGQAQLALRYFGILAQKYPNYHRTSPVCPASTRDFLTISGEVGTRAVPVQFLSHCTDGETEMDPRNKILISNERKR